MVTFDRYSEQGNHHGDKLTGAQGLSIMSLYHNKCKLKSHHELFSTKNEKILPRLVFGSIVLILSIDK